MVTDNSLKKEHENTLKPRITTLSADAFIVKSTAAGLVYVSLKISSLFPSDRPKFVEECKCPRN